MTLGDSRGYSEYEGKEAVNAILALLELRSKDARPITDKGSVFAETALKPENTSENNAVATSTSPSTSIG